MSEPKVFRVKKDAREPIPFNLVIDKDVKDEEGNVTGTEEVVEAFHAVPAIPGKMLLDVAAAMTGNGGEQAAAIRDFLTAVIPATEQENWNRVLNDSENVVDSAQLADIADWLMEQYGDRPTETA